MNTFSTNNTIREWKKVRLLLAAAFVLSVVVSQLVAMNAHAASLSKTFVRFDRINVNTNTTGTVCATPTTTATEASVKVTFPTGYTLGTAANFTVDTTTNTASWPTGGTAWLGIGTATNVTGQVVTFPSSDLTVGTLYCFNWINSAAVKTQVSASSTNTGSIETDTVTPTTIDTSNYVTQTITGDQVTVTASVPQAFSFALSGSTDSLTLATGSVNSSSTARTVTVNTNAQNGWMVWGQDSSTGLHSTTASKTIASTTPGANSTLSAGTEGYNTGVTSSLTSGSAITVAPAFVGGSTGKGGGLDTTLRTLASAGGPANTAVLTLTNNAAISGITPAASDYTDTITVTGAGLF